MPIQKWEHAILRWNSISWNFVDVDRPEVDNLTALGEEGWELVSAGSGVNAGELILFFKRPKA